MTPRGMLIKADVRRPVEVLFTVRLLDNVTNRLHMQELVERVSLVGERASSGHRMLHRGGGLRCERIRPV